MRFGHDPLRRDGATLQDNTLLFLCSKLDIRLHSRLPWCFSDALPGVEFPTARLCTIQHVVNTYVATQFLKPQGPLPHEPRDPLVLSSQAPPSTRCPARGTDDARTSSTRISQRGSLLPHSSSPSAKTLHFWLTFKAKCALQGASCMLILLHR